MRKGMSQTLALIVAASVLMMTALTVIFMTQGSLQGIFGDSAEQECIATIENTCRFSSGTHSTPSSCERAGIVGQSADVLGIEHAEGQIGQDTYDCRSQTEE